MCLINFKIYASDHDEGERIIQKSKQLKGKMSLVLMVHPDGLQFVDDDLALVDSDGNIKWLSESDSLFDNESEV